MGFGSLFGIEVGARKFYRRAIKAASAAGTYDLLTDEKYAPVIDELQSGRDVKAVQVCCGLTGGNIAEGKAAVDEVRYLLSAK